MLKPNDDYGGHGVYLGPRLDQPAWENAIAAALSSDYVVQEAVDLSPEDFPIFNESNWNLQPMFVDTNPFLFRGNVCGAMVRLSSSPIVQCHLWRRRNRILCHTVNTPLEIGCTGLKSGRRAG